MTIDREKAKSLHVPLSQITDTLGVYMGSAYVNDFDFNARSYRVYVQADKAFRSKAQDMKQFYVRSDSGAMVPLDNLIGIMQTATPQVISHYNLFRSQKLMAPLPGLAQASDRGDGTARVRCGVSLDWTGLSLEELQAGGFPLSYLDWERWSCISRFQPNGKFRAAIYCPAGRAHGTARGASAQWLRVCRMVLGGTGHAGRSSSKNAIRRVCRAAA